MTGHREAMEINRARWDELVPHHRDSEFYDLDSFLAGRQTVDDIVLERLGDVDGKRLLHLQCHFGIDTISLARLGAHVTGVDFSRPAVELAADLAGQVGVDARFIEANIYDLPDILDEQFDLVFTSHGTITWLPDIDGWARVVAQYLNPGGTFVFVDSHPLTWIMKQDNVERIEFEFSYFNHGRTFAFDEDGSYTDGAEGIQNRDSREWHHRTDDIVNAIVASGLTIERLGEHPVLAWRMLPFMERTDDGLWRIPDDQVQLPLMLSIVARRPKIAGAGG